MNKIAQKLPRKTRAELAKDVDADYYGYRDEDDGVIVPLEQDEEKKGDAYTFILFASKIRGLMFYIFIMLLCIV